MAKNSSDIDRLLGEFKAQDHSVQLVVMTGFNRVIAATFSEGNQGWELTDAGRDLLYPPDESAPTPEPPKGMQPRNIDVRMPSTSKK